MDVAAWLRDLGLERYVSAFRDNDIDAEVLLKLTAEDLISIGSPRSATGASCSARLPASAWRFRPPWWRRPPLVHRHKPRPNGAS
jgi:hypothetical protein